MGKHAQLFNFLTAKYGTESSEWLERRPIR